MIVSIAIVAACLALGGILKGATGAGAPILAVPALATLFDVQFAVAIMLVPNLVSNGWQAWQYRRHVSSRSFATTFALAGAAGVFVGTLMLAALPHETLSLLVAVVVAVYIVFRLVHADWLLAFERAARLSLPVGLAAGILQGASGISAPVSITFLNAMRLERTVFIATISIFFVVMTFVQIPLAAALGILTPERTLLSSAAILPLMGFMPVGAAVARRMSRAAFDRLILCVLAVLALKLAYDAFV